MFFGVFRDPRQQNVILKQNNSFFLNKCNLTMFINGFTPYLCSFWRIYFFTWIHSYIL